MSPPARSLREVNSPQSGHVNLVLLRCPGRRPTCSRAGTRMVTLAPGERPLSPGSLVLYFAPVVVFLTVGAFVSLILGTLPKGGPVFSLGRTRLRRRHGLAHRPDRPGVVAIPPICWSLPSWWFPRTKLVDAWMIDRPAPRWTSALIPLCIAGGATFDLFMAPLPAEVIRSRSSTKLPPTPSLMRLSIRRMAGEPWRRCAKSYAPTGGAQSATLGLHTLTFGGTPVADQPDGLAEALLRTQHLDSQPNPRRPHGGSGKAPRSTTATHNLWSISKDTSHEHSRQPRCPHPTRAGGSRLIGRLFTDGRRPRRPYRNRGRGPHSRGRRLWGGVTP